MLPVHHAGDTQCQDCYCLIMKVLSLPLYLPPFTLCYTKKVLAMHALHNLATIILEFFSGPGLPPITGAPVTQAGAAWGVGPR